MPIPTFSAGQYPTAAALNTALTAAFPVGIDAWTAYVPTLTQSVTVTKTTSASYIKIGRLVVALMQLGITGTGTAANVITMGLPVAAPGGGFMAGIGGVIDQSAGQILKGVAYLETATTFSLLPTATTGGGRLGQESFTAALANTDTVFALLVYQSAA